MLEEIISDNKKVFCGSNKKSYKSDNIYFAVTMTSMVL